MDENDERRCSNRIDYAINVTYKFDDGSSFKVTQSVNVNNCGMSLKVNKVVPVAKNISFMIDGYEDVFNAKVIWCKREAEIIGASEDIDEYQVGITYEQGIAERVNEILREIIGDDFDHKTPR